MQSIQFRQTIFKFPSSDPLRLNGDTTQVYRNRNRTLGHPSPNTGNQSIAMDPITGEALKVVTGAVDNLKSGGEAVASGDMSMGARRKAESTPAVPLSSSSS